MAGHFCLVCAGLCAFCAVAALLGRCRSLPCFPDEDTKVQRGPVTWRKPHSSGETEQGFEPRFGPSQHAFE